MLRCGSIFNSVKKNGEDVKQYNNFLSRLRPHARLDFKLIKRIFLSKHLALEECVQVPIKSSDLKQKTKQHNSIILIACKNFHKIGSKQNKYLRNYAFCIRCIKRFTTRTILKEENQKLQALVRLDSSEKEHSFQN